jgi:hypothetical protein
VDADYRGEVGVVLFNHSDKDFHSEYAAAAAAAGSGSWQSWYRHTSRVQLCGVSGTLLTAGRQSLQLCTTRNVRQTQCQ